MNVFIATVVWFLCCASVLRAFLHHRSLVRHFADKRAQLSSFAGSDAAGAPLFLTPYIDDNKIEEARNLACVEPPIGNIISYSGFLTVNRTTKSHLFFWYIPRTKIDYTPTPLILWLQGGPGASSLYGLFAENGPFEITDKGLHLRKYAWTNNYDMLYVDQPVGTGFSFTEDETNGYIGTQREVGEHMYEALIQFYRLFPKVGESDLYLAGESYAGKFIPTIGKKIDDANQQPNVYRIPLKGMMIGNGFCDPINMAEYAAFLEGVGLIDAQDRVSIQATQEKVKDLLRKEQWKAANDMWNKLLDEDIIGVINSTSLYDYTKDELHKAEPYVKFVTQDKIRASIHVGSTRYEMIAKSVMDRFEEDFLQSARPQVEALLEHYPMLFYSGQLDIIVAFPLSENFLRNVQWSGASKYLATKRQLWTEDSLAAGFYRSYGNLNNVLVRNAGHMVPASQPKNALSLIDKFIKQDFQQQRDFRRIYYLRPPNFMYRNRYIIH